MLIYTIKKHVAAVRITAVLLFGIAMTCLALPRAAVSQRAISADSDELVFLAAGEPRLDFQVVYVPDQGSDASRLQSELALAGIRYSQYVSLSDKNLVQALQARNAVSLVPAKLFGNVAVAGLLSDDHFAFQVTQNGAESVSIPLPGGGEIEALEEGSFPEGNRPTVTASAGQVPILIGRDIPDDGALDVFLYRIQPNRSLVATFLQRGGFELGAMTVIDQNDLRSALQASGSVLMLLAQYQDDAVIRDLGSDSAELDFLAATSFGVLPVWPVVFGAESSSGSSAEAPDEPVSTGAEEDAGETVDDTAEAGTSNPESVSESSAATDEPPAKMWRAMTAQERHETILAEALSAMPDMEMTEVDVSSLSELETDVVFSLLNQCLRSDFQTLDCGCAAVEALEMAQAEPNPLDPRQNELAISYRRHQRVFEKQGVGPGVGFKLDLDTQCLSRRNLTSSTLSFCMNNQVPQLSMTGMLGSGDSGEGFCGCYVDTYLEQYTGFLEEAGHIPRFNRDTRFKSEAIAVCLPN
ncbi:hypothetical protein OCH239_09005 [Roseivivax halodurans JCM 10272]|uniref:Uncharacterized protein n=1 Tax=Roseivivax halodurans JCM 10272 TaxID=1449350 RepID=X7ECM9_9RHOB|nr:hypothetical protein [Roseivivax halodurans]ETX13707.1 hypothetical protein OCH239_09005 [Roseivivax halodurans JCM 10272]